MYWYLAYGSNLSADRLAAYLAGRAAGERFGPQHGSPDPTPPADSRWIQLDREVYFSGHSTKWGGAPAFLALDRDPLARSWCRAWLLRPRQIEAVFGQENGATILGLPDPLPQPHRATVLDGSGRYRAILRLPDIDGVPCLTCTAPQRGSDAAPSSSYRDVIAEGLREGSGLSNDEIDAYLPTPRREPGPDQAANHDQAANQ